NETIVYELLTSFQGLYIFHEVTQSKLPTNKVEVALISHTITTFLKFRELLMQSLKDYIVDTYITSIDSSESVTSLSHGTTSLIISLLKEEGDEYQDPTYIETDSDE
ncbi:4370_t:CDS:2, partial [Entrophospora sp. SA101]